MNIDDVDPLIQNIYHSLELIGVFLAAIVGGTVARRYNLDIIGFFIMALVSSLGGGMLRDMLIGQGTVAAMRSQEYLLLALAGALIAWLTLLRGWLWDLTSFHMDMVVLGVWAVTGTTKALNYGLPWISCVFMGVLTALGGGMLRDICIGKIPALFTSQQMYVIPATIASVAMIAFFEADREPVGMVLSPILAFVLAMLSYWMGWYIPARQDFAPLNSIGSQLRQALSPVEEAGREVAREVEPKWLRKWRHKQMEKSAAESQEDAQEDVADETLTEKQVREEVSDDTSREEFLDAPYKAYMDAPDQRNNRETLKLRRGRA
ncbi:trimeric intracellular cation channel family protein [Corynebacterium breve]|uniref:Trimeric intracellular cation channel family protein n=1 Tax=Corynebacterium breve TaxID=3049799 RepID=A0ABY8VDT8_9CORY|nr:trimeric intracellular cation channel family protein [Corynebacterium breve]WIM67634.1 trimeric intracellular cation channel family protein [Corynebacterium breve]